MKLLRSLPPEEAEDLRTLSCDTDLILKDGGDYSHYFGISYDEKYAARVGRLNAILKESIAGFERFCNFTTLGRIRFMYDWCYDNDGNQGRPEHFSGVGYIKVEEVVSGAFETPVTSCPNCGGRLCGDGYTRVVHCEMSDVPLDVEPDALPIYCAPAVEEGASTKVIPAWLDDYQLAALRYMRDSYGRQAKSMIRDQWTNGNVRHAVHHQPGGATTDYAPALQQIRNHQKGGRSFLQKVSLKALE